MNIRDGTERKVSFNARDELEDKIDKLTVVMSRLAAKDSYEKRPFKPQIHKSRGQNRSYNQRGYQNTSGRSDSRNRGQYGNNRPRQNYRDNNFRGNTRGYGRQDNRGEYRDNRHNEYNRGRNRSRERTFSRNYGNNRDRSSSNSRSRSGSQASTNRDRIRCYNCREYDHFVRDCPNSREERDLEQLQQMLNLEAEEQTHLLNQQTRQLHTKLQESFKLMNGRDGTTAFLPLDSRIGGQGRYNHPTVGQFLTREQTRYIYKKIETGEIINTDMIEQEIEQERQLDKMDDTSRETNPYRELIVNNAEKIEPLMTQMEQWSILSNVLNYVQHSRLHSMNHMLDIKAVDKYKYRPHTDNREFKETRLWYNSTEITRRIHGHI